MFRDSEWTVETFDLREGKLDANALSACTIGLVDLTRQPLEGLHRLSPVIKGVTGLTWVALVERAALALAQLRAFIATHCVDYHTAPFDRERLLFVLGHAAGMAALDHAQWNGSPKRSGPELLAPTLAAQPVQRSRIVLVEDHAILREGIRALLDLEPDLLVSAQATNGLDAVELVQSVAPRLLITDIAGPTRSGIELIACVRALQSQVRILVLTADDSEKHIRAALQAGANGYVLKDANRQELLRAIRSVLAGEVYLCPGVISKVVTSYVNGAPIEVPAMSAEITSREREVLTQIALGHSNKLIGRNLGVSVKTVEKHRSNVMRKLTLRNTAALTRFAIGHGMVTTAGVERKVEAAEVLA